MFADVDSPSVTEEMNWAVPSAMWLRRLNSQATERSSCLDRRLFALPDPTDGFVDFVHPFLYPGIVGTEDFRVFLIIFTKDFRK